MSVPIFTPVQINPERFQYCGADRTFSICSRVNRRILAQPQQLMKIRARGDSISTQHSDLKESCDYFRWNGDTLPWDVGHIVLYSCMFSFSWWDKTDRSEQLSYAMISIKLDPGPGRKVRVARSMHAMSNSGVFK